MPIITLWGIWPSGAICPALADTPANPAHAGPSPMYLKNLPANCPPPAWIRCWKILGKTKDDHTIFNLLFDAGEAESIQLAREQNANIRIIGEQTH